MKLGDMIKGFVGQERDEHEYEEYGADVQEIIKQPKHRSTIGSKIDPKKVLMYRELFEYPHAVEVCEALISGTTVVCNLQRCDEKVVRRILDFLAGAVYTLQGEIRLMGDRIFVCTPSHVVLDGKYYDDQEEARRHVKDIKMPEDSETHSNETEAEAEQHYL